MPTLSIPRPPSFDPPSLHRTSGQSSIEVRMSEAQQWNVLLIEHITKWREETTSCRKERDEIVAKVEHEKAEIVRLTLLAAELQASIALKKQNLIVDKSISPNSILLETETAKIEPTTETAAEPTAPVSPTSPNTDDDGVHALSKLGRRTSSLPMLAAADGTTSSIIQSVRPNSPSRKRANTADTHEMSSANALLVDTDAGKIDKGWVGAKLLLETEGGAGMSVARKRSLFEHIIANVSAAATAANGPLKGSAGTSVIGSTSSLALAGAAGSKTGLSSGLSAGPSKG
ncbi:hypothetical protein HDU93_005424 [Gonapodya sp. JEL0774]|nr:hypothetical protein HDU93_005424 [Gonapodya sp. JEL0774]